MSRKNRQWFEIYIISRSTLERRLIVKVRSEGLANIVLKTVIETYANNPDWKVWLPFSGGLSK